VKITLVVQHVSVMVCLSRALPLVATLLQPSPRGGTPAVAIPAIESKVGTVTGMRRTERYAVLVDAENTQYSRMELVMDELANFGTTSIRLVYGDFTKQHLSPWRTVALDLSFRSVNAFSFTAGKGSSDAAMIIDAMDILHTNDAVDGFALVSSDSDFTGLAQRLRQAGKTVLGVGKQGTPKPFVTACDRFIYLENLGSSVAEGSSSSKRKRAVDAQTLRLLRDAVADCSDEDGWAELSDLGIALTQRKADFDTRTFGFRKLGKLLASQAKVFEVKEVRDSKKVKERDGTT